MKLRKRNLGESRRTGLRSGRGALFVVRKAGVRGAIGLPGLAGSAVMVIGTILLTVGTIREPVLIASAVAGVGLLYLGFKRPDFAVGLWLFLVVLIPDWTPVSLAGQGFRPLSIIGIPILIGLLMAKRFTGLRLHWSDISLVLACAIVAAFVTLDGYPFYFANNLILILGLSYLLGRLSATRAVHTAFAVVMTLVAIWAIAEFFLDLHVYTGWFPSSSHHWEEIQGRAGLYRSEAGFGHALALGGSLVLAIPFAQELPRFARTSQVLLAAATVLTLSRAPMIALVLVFALGAVTTLKGSARLFSLGALAVGVIAVSVFFSFIEEEGGREVQTSTDARVWQWAQVLAAARIIGAAGGFTTAEESRITVAGLTVIDSTPLRLSLNFGVLVAALILAPLFLAMVDFIRGRASVATIAVLSQVPVLLFTSPITQWQGLVFFVAGMSVTASGQFSRDTLAGREERTGDRFGLGRECERLG